MKSHSVSCFVFSFFYLTYFWESSLFLYQFYVSFYCQVAFYYMSNSIVFILCWWVISSLRLLRLKLLWAISVTDQIHMLALQIPMWGFWQIFRFKIGHKGELPWFIYKKWDRRLKSVASCLSFWTYTYQKKAMWGQNYKEDPHQELHQAAILNSD